MVRPKARVHFVLDEDIEKITINFEEPRQGKENGRKSARVAKSMAKTNTPSSRWRSCRGVKEDMDSEEPDIDELGKLVDEELPEEFTSTNKPTALLGEEEAHPAQFGFQTPNKKRGSMYLKAQQSASKYSTPGKEENKTPHKTPRRVSFCGEMGATPADPTNHITPSKSVLKRRENVMGDMAASPRTPRGRRSLVNQFPAVRETKKEISLPKTPRSLRNHTKAMIQKCIASQDSGSDEDFSADEDDFSPSEESSESSEQSSDEDEDSTAEEEPVKKVEHQAHRASSGRQTRKSKREANDIDEFTSDAYFETQHAKVLTSNNTLSRLRTPCLQRDRMEELLSVVDGAHYEPIARLSEECRSLSRRWLLSFREGYSVLLYGLGSKRHLLQSFHREKLAGCNVLVINGFFPGLTVKEVVDSILSEILGVKDTPANVLESLDMIESVQKSRKAKQIYLIVHNLDGPSLRCDRAQTVLSHIARMPNTYLIATVDHINAPLMWDQAKLRRYNFLWWDVTTFVAYSDETSFESSLLVQQTGALALSSLRSVFKSLTPNAKKIFMMIAKHQLENKSNPNYGGIAFRKLYWECREAFLVSTDAVLRAQLTEFLDHNLIKSKRGSDATEVLVIPIDSGILSQFIESQEEE